MIDSEQAHRSVFNVLALLGLGKDRIERVAADSQDRIDTSRIPELDARSLLILQAGNVNTGAFDAFEEICDPARCLQKDRSRFFHRLDQMIQAVNRGRLK